MIIMYRDNLGNIAREVNEEYGISFCDGKVYFTDTSEKDFTIPVDSVTEIRKGDLNA